MTRVISAIMVAAVSLLILASCNYTAPLRFSPPLQCVPGKTCFLQNTVDVDPGPGARDFTCGRATYDGHEGTDFRLLSTKATEQGVPVLAAAPGRVVAVRDGMADRLITKETGNSVRGRDCGNGVRIDHGKGWETQYCHLKRGSISVKKGDPVKRGAQLGNVGYSGRAQFAHIHMAVRHNGKIIDPFTGRAPDGVCGKGMSGTLWARKIIEAIPHASGAVIAAGFATGPVTPKALERGDILERPGLQAPAVVFYARLINLRKGDQIRLVLEGPEGRMAQNSIKPLPRAKAHYAAYAGRKRRGTAWPQGRYRGRVEVMREGGVVLSNEVELDMKP